MENRDRDKMSRNINSTEAGKVNRETSKRKSEQSDDSNVDFGKNIGRSEELNDEPGRRSGSGSMSSTGNGRVGSTGIGKGSNKQIDEPSRSSSSGSSESEH